MTRSFDNFPYNAHDYAFYAISTTRPQKYRNIPVLYIFATPYEVQIEFNLTKDLKRFNERMAAAIKQRASAIEDWVKANSEKKICLLCWENIDSCHRRLIADSIRTAGDKSGISVNMDLG